MEEVFEKTFGSRILGINLYWKATEQRGFDLDKTRPSIFIVTNHDIENLKIELVEKVEIITQSKILTGQELKDYLDSCKKGKNKQKKAAAEKFLKDYSGLLNKL